MSEEAQEISSTVAENDQIFGHLLNVALTAFSPEVKADLQEALVNTPIGIIGQLLESLPEVKRSEVFQLLEPHLYWTVAKELQPETAKTLIRSLPGEIKQSIQGSITAEDIQAYSISLPKQMIDAFVLDQDESTLNALQVALSYDNAQVGRYLDKQIIRVRPDVSISTLSDRIKRKGQLHGIYVVDETGALQGHISTELILDPSDERPVSDLMRPIVAFEHSDQFKDILKSVHPDDQVAWYPVKKDGVLIGCFPVSAILWELQDSIVSNVVTEAPSTDEGLFTPIPKAAKLRAFWLVINLLTAFMASAVIAIFEGTLQQVVALAILMPVVASMGGIAGSQTLAVALRGLALKHVTNANLDLLLKKESKIAAINGVAIGFIIAAVVAWWFSSLTLGFIIFVAIVLNSLAAASSGTLIPFILNKFNIDPAISGAVILTTVTDIVGFVVFLGLGTLLLIG